MEMPSFADGLGRRVPLLGAAGERLESLRLCPEIADTPVTRAALVERAARLSEFQCPAFARVRRVERLGGIGGGLSLVSDAPFGVRLSDLLRQAERRNIELDPNAALFLIQQIAAALAALHAHGRDAAHGALGPERIVVTPDGSPVVAEYVLASALEQLQFSRSQLWTLFRVPVPAVAGTVRFDQQTDVVQLGVLALALLLGRILLRDEFPQRLSRLLDEAATLDAFREPHGGLSRPIRSWVARALQLDSRTSFRTAVEAEAALALALGEDKACRPSAAAVQAFLSQCCSLEESPASGVAVQRRTTPAGAVVSIPPRADVTTRLGRTGEERPFDRGSGAQRVTRGGAEPEPTSVQVLADLSDVPSTQVSPAREEVVTPRDGARRSVPACAEREPAGRWAALRRMLRVGAVAMGLLVLFGASFLGARAYLRPALGSTGTVVVDSRPAGLELLVDGEPRGRTPLTLQLPVGSHALAVRTGRRLTELPITVAAGTQQVKRIEVKSPSRPARRRVPGK